MWWWQVTKLRTKLQAVYVVENLLLQYHNFLVTRIPGFQKCSGKLSKFVPAVIATD